MCQKPISVFYKTIKPNKILNCPDKRGGRWERPPRYAWPSKYYLVALILFFRNLANNASVFGSLIDDAEEEECKEIILVYYHLIASQTPLNPEQLDDRIEAWMEEKFGTKIDFDINGPLRNLQAIRGKIVKDGEAEASMPEIPLLTYDNQGFCQVPSLDDAKTIVDYVWDNAFLYAK